MKNFIVYNLEFLKRLSPSIKLLLLIFLLLMTGLRVYNLDQTARFTQDESSDLARMYQYYNERKITLVGPISNDNSKVFGSLTYYMLMPFAIIGNFHPVSPVYGTAFWGVLTGLIIIGITYRLNRRLLIPVMLLTLIWYPLLQTSRWAWNPHLVPFWIALGIWLYLRKDKYSLFVSGLSFALAFHHHYIAILATGVFMALAGISLVRDNKYKLYLYLMAGFILPFLTFVAFDLRHPPGLFFGKYLTGSGTPHVESAGIEVLAERLINSFIMMGFSMAEQTSAVYAILGLLGILLLYELRKLSPNLFWAVPFIAQVAGGLYLEDYFTRYFLPGLVFLLVYLIVPRKHRFPQLLVSLIWGILMVSSIWSLPSALHQTKAPPDTRSVYLASQYIANTVRDEQVANPNIAVLSSRDSDPLGAKYRDMLSMYGVSLRAPSEYDASENLFVISTANLRTLMKDESTSMVYFRDSRLVDVIPLKNSAWAVYWFSH
jgi:hypothetical protein